MKNISLKFIFLILIFALSVTTLLSIGKTFAFFDDNASSNNNLFQAGAWVPILDSIGDKSGVEGELLHFTVSASDPNGDALTYSAENLPIGASFDPNTQLFSWTPSLGQARTYVNVHFEVTDEKYIDSENITITIAEAPAVQIDIIGIDNITSNSAIISWQTNESVASSTIEYGLEEGSYTDPSYGVVWSTPNNYQVELESLSAGSPYHFRVKIIDNLGREGFSGDNTFTTLHGGEEGGKNPPNST